MPSTARKTASSRRPASARSKAGAAEATVSTDQPSRGIPRNAKPRPTASPLGTGPAAPAGAAPLAALAQQVRNWADTLMGVAGSATDLGLKLTEARLQDPGKRAAVNKAGKQLRAWREAAGMTVSEVADAVGLGDARLIDEAEGGVAALPFEVVLRLAAVLGRHDPIPVAMALTRQYNPELWKTLESLGIGKLAIQGARERELANIYRANDAARQLSDEQFALILAFTRQAFESALALTARR